MDIREIDHAVKNELPVMYEGVCRYEDRGKEGAE